MIHTHTCFVHFSCFVSIDTFQILIFIIIIWNRKKHTQQYRQARDLFVCLFYSLLFLLLQILGVFIIKKWMNEEDFFIWSFCCWFENLFIMFFQINFMEGFLLTCVRLVWKKNIKKIFWILKFFSKSKILWIFGFFFRKVTTRLPQIFRRKNH